MEPLWFSVGNTLESSSSEIHPYSAPRLDVEKGQTMAERRLNDKSAKKSGVSAEK